MTQAIFIILIVALFAAWCILLLRKLGVIEWVQAYACLTLSRLASCDFCLSWWTCVVVSCVIAMLLEQWLVLLVPFVSTPITRKLL